MWWVVWEKQGNLQFGGHLGPQALHVEYRMQPLMGVTMSKGQDLGTHSVINLFYT